MSLSRDCGTGPRILGKRELSRRKPPTRLAETWAKVPGRPPNFVSNTNLHSRKLSPIVIAGLVRATHVKDVDARDKRGHDGLRILRIGRKPRIRLLMTVRLPPLPRMKLFIEAQAAIRSLGAGAGESW
jgi:hypothetical protein